MRKGLDLKARATNALRKTYSESTLTSAFPQEELLSQLEQLGVEWYITEKGTPWLKYWQIGAEDFVPIERIAELREGGEMHPEANALDWVSQNLVYLRKVYAGKWIAVIGDQVDCAAEDLPSLLQLIRDRAVDQPFITQIPAAPIVWATTF